MKITKWSSMILAFGLVFSGCAKNSATSNGINFDSRPIDLIGPPKYSVLGPVALEKNWHGILGLSTPAIPIPFFGTIPGTDIYIYQWGEITYLDLLLEAKKFYIDADAVIDIVDYTASRYWLIYGKRKNIVTGIAIKYSRDEVGYPIDTQAGGQQTKIEVN